MTELLYAEINAAGIVLLLLFLNNMHRNSHKSMPMDHTLFRACMSMNILIFALDTAMWLLDGRQTAIMRTANLIVTMLYYVSNPLICLIWLMYTDYKIYESREGLLKRVRLYAIPCALSAALSMASMRTGWLFVIDGANKYARGPWFWLMASAALFYLLLSFGMALKDIMVNGWEQNKSVNVHLVLFPLGIIAASVLQIIFYGVSIIWVCSMIAFASIYINIQNAEISTDHLTGLYNRRRLDEHFQRKLKLRKKNHQLFAMMLDLDDFKKINDQYGHETGDDALIRFADLLRQVCFGSDDFIARVGGDEFFILGERVKEDEIAGLRQHILSAAEAFNERRETEYLLRPSMGCCVYRDNDTAGALFAAADQRMYQDKLERKRAVR